MSRFFINRPIVAMVIAILTVIVGAVTINALPVAQFPNIVPPEIQLQATYPGADAQTLEQAVATPIEQQINGVDNLNYMYSLNATANSQTTLLASRNRFAGGHFLFSFRCLVSPSIRFHGLDWCWPSAWSWMTPLSLSKVCSEWRIANFWPFRAF